MSKENGLGWTTLSVDDSGGSVQAIKNDVTSLDFSTPREVQDTTGIDVGDIAEKAELLGIGHLLDRMPATLSGGEAQRVAIGRALLAGPRVLLLDEPLASLDAARREEIMQLLERIRSELALPVLHVSHDRTEVDRLADLLVEMA